MGSSKAKTCFVIAQFGAKEDCKSCKWLKEDIKTIADAVFDRSEKVYKDIISPIVEKRSYKVTRADKMGSPGQITDHIIKQLVTADLVIADLTHKNPNVFYELAIRYSINKPVILIAESGEELPFDVRQYRTIFFNHNDAISVNECKEKIVAQISEFEEGFSDVNNPVAIITKLSPKEKIVALYKLLRVALSPKFSDFTINGIINDHRILRWTGYYY